jgi:SP family arabinose:H+ symporter-like MFS transporter
MNKQKHKKGMLVFIAFVAGLGGFLFGFDTAVISGTIEFVEVQFGLDSVQLGWYVSSALVGCLTGAMIAGRLSDQFGRKPVLMLAAFMFFLSALGCMLSGSFQGLILYRILGGLGVGVASVLSPLFISEFSPPDVRGRMVSIYQLAITLGILLAYFSNAWLNHLSDIHRFHADGILSFVIGEQVWRGMFGTEMIPASVFLFSLFFVPESPRWLVKQNMDQKALKAFMKISDEKTARFEIDQIRQVIRLEGGSIRELFSSELRPALIIGISLAVLSQFSGINAIIYYGPKILNEAGFTLNDALGGQVTIGLVNVLFTFVAIFTVDRFGRRPLLIIGVSMAAFSLIMVGIMFQAGMDSGFWVLVFILLFIASFAFGFGPMVWVLLSEIYPTKIRGRAIAIASLSLWLANVIVGQVVPWLLENVGASWTFWLFALLCTPAIWITVKKVPETKGKSLEEIERFWYRNNSD